MFKLLVVEDEEMIRSKILNNVDWKGNGFTEVYEAEDGVDALGIIKSKDIDIVVTDIQMPKMDGIELIRQIKDYNKNIKVVVISGYAEFEYAKESIKLSVKDYILKPFITKNLLDIVNKVKEEIIRERNEMLEIENMRRQLRENKKQLQEKLFNDLLNNNFIGNIDNDLRYLELSRIKGLQYFVVVLNIDNFSEIIDESDEEQKYIYNLTLFNWVKKFLNDYGSIDKIFSGFKLEYFIINYKIDQIVLIFYNDVLEITPILEELINRSSKDIGLKLTAGIGNVYSSLRDMYVSYKEACSAAMLSCIHGKGIVYSFNDMNFDNKMYSKQLHMLVDNRLYDDLKIGAFDKVKKDIINIITEIKNSMLEMEAVNTIINNIILLSCKAINELGYNVFDIFGSSFNPYFDIKNINDLTELEEWFFSFFHKINDYITDKRSNRNKQLILEIKEYIDHNYYKNINLTTLSKRYNISSGYLSILFSEMTGQNFIDYLTNLRIQKAKELLKSTDLRIYEIAEKVGYRDAYYFSTAFKKVVGINPTEYRETLEML